MQHITLVEYRGKNHMTTSIQEKYLTKSNVVIKTLKLETEWNFLILMKDIYKTHTQTHTHTTMVV